MREYKPTYLYIKKHNITGLLYFGKTTKKDPVSYLGSGKRWIRHLNKHGKDISTVWYELFSDSKLLTEFALFFSEFNNIVKSVDWANLRAENGLDGGSIRGRKNTKESKHRMSGSAKLRKPTQETKDKISKKLKGKIVSAETREKLSTAKQNVSRETRQKQRDVWTKEKRDLQSARSVTMNANRDKIVCPHCNTVGLHRGMMTKYHFDNCFILPENNSGRQLVSPDGKIISVSNFNAFGRILGISGERLRLVSVGKLHQYKGWTLAATPNET